MFNLSFSLKCALLPMPVLFQVQVLAEFGDLPQNVDLVVLQQLPVSLELNYLEVPIALHALHRNSTNRIHFAFCALSPLALCFF
jgi:hypothetical protein